MIALPLYPQLRFKSTLRTVSIDPAGIKTTRGNQSKSYRWTDIAAIADADDTIVMTVAGVNRNSFIVPRRAFADDAARQRFLQDATLWRDRGNGAA